MSALRRASRRGESAQAFVELAVALPVLAAFVLGLAAGWQMLNSAIGLTESARVAAQIAVNDLGNGVTPANTNIDVANAIQSEQGNTSVTWLAQTTGPYQAAVLPTPPVIGACPAARACFAIQTIKTGVPVGSAAQCEIEVVTLTYPVAPGVPVASRLRVTTRASLAYIPVDPRTETPKCNV